jgi:23S rRNA (cytosine1962-C5)-methyltransferase
VVLRKDLARSIRQGHPWIYRDALVRRDDLESGALVEVQTRDGRPLAHGFWDARSPIAVRVLESGGPGHRFTDIDKLVRDRLRSALDRRLARLDLSTTNAFRWVHGEGDLLPGIHVDFYADTAVVRFDGDGARAFYEPLDVRLREAAGTMLPLRVVIDRESRLGSLGVPRVETRGMARDGEDRESIPRVKTRGIEELEVLENGLRFCVDLVRGQKGGLFLDQRENRMRVAERAAGKSVLNLFGYTGGFSVHAAAAGAIRTDTVDLARPAIEAARRNFERNGLSLANAGFHAVDAFAFLSAAGERGEQWDIVISDPPSFAPRRDTVPAARQAYTRLHRLAVSVTAPGGLLCAASCSSHFGRDDFLASIEAGARQAGRRWQLESLHGAAFDHPVLPAFPEGDYLKFAVGRVG